MEAPRILKKITIFFCMALLVALPIFASQPIEKDEIAPFSGRIFTAEETKSLLLKLDQLENLLQEKLLLEQKIQALEEKVTLLQEQRSALLNQVELFEESLALQEKIQERYENLWRIADEMIIETKPSVALQSGIYTSILVVGILLGIYAGK